MDENNLEAQNYSQASYRALQRMRARGAEYGVDIPVLKYPLLRDNSGGILLKVMTVLSAIIIAATLGVLIWTVAKVLVPLLEAAMSATELVDSIKNIPVINAIGAIPSLLIWTIVFAIVLGLVAVVCCSIVYLFGLIKTNRLSIQEKAVGYFLSSIKTSALILGVILLFGGVAALLFISSKLVGVVFLIAAVYAIAMFTALQRTRNEAKVQFNKLPIEQQNDFMEHNRALRLASSRHAMRKQARVLGTGNYRHMGKFGWIFALLDGFIDAREVYNNLKNNEEFRPISTGLARRALWQLLYFAVTCLLTAGLFYLVMKFIFVNVEFMQIMAMILVFFLLVGEFLINLPQILNYNIKQLRLNKKPLGKIALALTLAVTVAVVVTTVVVLLLIKNS